MAFKVLNALEEQAQSEWEACLPQEVDLQTQALVAALRPAAAAHGPKGALRSGGATRGCTLDAHRLENASNAAVKATGQSSAPSPELRPSPARHAVKMVTGRLTALEKWWAFYASA